MARKAVLEGGKRDEIIQAAMKLFLTNGYENTSVRMILNEVDGEVGMFYHYFKSKDELFQTAVDRFFQEYQKKFIQLSENCMEREEFIHQFLRHYEESMQQYRRIAPNIHWTMQCAMSVRTIESLKPCIEAIISRWTYQRKLPLDMAARQVLYVIAATVHSEDFPKMSMDEKYAVMNDNIDRLLS